MITGIVVALPEELGTLTSKKIDKGCCAFIADNLLVAYSGAGPENAKRAAEQLVAQNANRLISWGCAAALINTLAPGDLTLADGLIDADQVLIDQDLAWHGVSKNELSKQFAVHTGALAESMHIVSTSKAKKQLQSETRAIVVDMESVAIAKVAKQHRLSFLAIRTVADPVGMDVSPAVTQSLNAQGDVVLCKLLAFVATHPTELPGLIKLALHFNAAKNTLKRVAKQLNALTCYPKAL